MTYTEIGYEVSERIATITLNRPQKLNAFTHVMRGEIIAALDEAEADDDVRAVIVTGAGRAFCAGADLSAGEDTFNSRSNGVRAAAHRELGEVDGVPRDGGGTVALRLAAMRKPTVGAINGAAVGVGATMTLPMDIRIAAESARFGFVFTRRGLLPEAASSWFLPRVVGISQAMEWAATGRIFDSAEALTGRLVSRVVADDELLETARSICREIVENTSAVSVAVARQLLWGMLSADSPWEAHRLDSKGINVLGAGADAAEGVGSFLAKRPPEFPLRVSEDYPDFMPEWPARPEGV
ncbi:crotonase/enoyl-CoA hydratase family protein [Saccharopolyspora sp. TS4A08]|uniref:Crotonase/enoyl-CoA hydratase family protein n=1 Tax=Saccharopolyspora ipomoeae TaxID=3042027 RepID=A0ABT6PW69_9PSEU|nr:crotonase/enoyl-CoA hydratase family protein [Saccharopolyspora sp. TS4A08]MDI2032255.1 crotonase/enoyl-CoA hydratase family protein [Saccharopolyspora sp. TS4A08]